MLAAGVVIAPLIESLAVLESFLTELSLASLPPYWINTDASEVVLPAIEYNSSFTTNSSGTKSIKWENHLLSTGYVLNISTYSNFEKTLPDNFEFGSFTSSINGT